jgi:hypothetical protein
MTPPEPSTAGDDTHRDHDPLAVALGNATLLGIGYLLLRRWRTAAGAVAVTGVLLVIVSAAGQPGWTWRVVALLWWVATIVHGWYLAGGKRRSHQRQASEVRRQRVIAAGAASAVLVIGLGTEVDARRIEAAAADAHRDNDCDEAIATLDRIGFRHRLVDPLVTDRAERGVTACRLLQDALELTESDPAAAADILGDYLDHRSALWDGASELRTDLLLTAAGAALDEALTGDTDSLESGFDTLATVLVESPARAEEVDRVVDDYLGRLSAVPACDAEPNVDWLRDGGTGGDALDRAVAALPETAPPILASCGDELLDDDPARARDAYQALLDGYPDHPLAATVEPKIEQADTLIERDEVSRLLEGWPDHVEADNYPPYCEEPARYRGAPPYTGPGPHLIAAFGLFAAVPREWRANDLDDAAVVLCAEPLDYGTLLGTCDFDTDQWGFITVDLYTNELTIHAYELRTGDPVLERVIEYGSGCPVGPVELTGTIQPNRVWALGNGQDEIRSVIEALAFP